MDWNVEKYREEHESEEQWLLRRTFMEKWKNDYPEDRLVCFAKVFANMEFMGCRYPTEIMQEVAKLSYEVAKEYRNIKKTKLQRTFVSASDAAEDRAKGIKREGGVVKEVPPSKTMKIDFVPQGHNLNCEKETAVSDSENDLICNDTNGTQLQNEGIFDSGTDIQCQTISNMVEQKDNKKSSETLNSNHYLEEMLNDNCLSATDFKEWMFQTEFGKMVLLVRPWVTKMGNILATCQACNMPVSSSYENGCFSLCINGKLVASATGDVKAEARSNVEIMAWNRLKKSMVVLLVKELWIAQGDSRISVNDVTGRSEPQFGTPVENQVALKMMKLMGWKGGGLGADLQGIAEPIKPNLQMVGRAGLGSGSSVDLRELKRAGSLLMRRFARSETLDVDLVFSSEFDSQERAALHLCARNAGLVSRSYGTDDRFLVVRKKSDPFSLVRAVVEKGGTTSKYQVFIPHALRQNGR